MMPTADEQTSRPPVSGIVWGIVLNAIIPVVLYKLSRRYLSPSEFTALLVASTFPLGKNVFDVVRRGQLDPISIVVLLGIAADGVALLFGGSARLLLVRESLFTGAFGFACFVSLLFPRSISRVISLLESTRSGRRDSTWPGNCPRCVFATG